MKPLTAATKLPCSDCGRPMRLDPDTARETWACPCGLRLERHPGDGVPCFVRNRPTVEVRT